MARFYYYVVSSGDGWEVKFQGQMQRFLYRTQKDALEAARSAARKYHEDSGKPTGVRLQSDGGRWRDEMTYGNDPFPPRG